MDPAHRRTITLMFIEDILESHKNKEPFENMYEYDIHYLVPFIDHLVIKKYVIDEDDPYSNHDYVAIEPVYGLSVTIKRGHVKKLKELLAAYHL